MGLCFNQHYHFILLGNLNFDKNFRYSFQITFKMLSDAFKYQQFVGHTLGYILIMENFTESLIVGRSLGLIEIPLVPKKMFK